MTIVEQLAEFAASLKLAALPEEVVHAGRRALLDTLGVAMAGSRDPSAVTVRRAYGSYLGRGPCTVIGGGDAMPEVAALCNGTAAHSPEQDDFHRTATIHPGVVVVPAALAAAQEAGAAGALLLESVIAGYEVAIRIGNATRGSLYTPGFHPTPAIGVFGAAVAAAHAMGLDAARTAHALGIAGTRSSGLLAYKARGDWTKRLQAGSAAEQGLGAARLAAAGYVGPLEVIEDRYGFLRAFAGTTDNAADVLQGLGERYHTPEITFKPYASCRFTHAPIDVLLAAMAEGKVQPAEIRRLEVVVHKQAILSVMMPADRKYRPQTAVDGQFSLAYCLAVAALRGQVVPEDFSPTALADPATLEMAARVVASDDPAYTALFPKQNAARITVVTDRGSWSAEVLDARGDPESPLSDADLESKFVALSRLLLDGDAPARALASLLWKVDQQPTLEPIVGPMKERS